MTRDELDRDIYAVRCGDDTPSAYGRILAAFDADRKRIAELEAENASMKALIREIEVVAEGGALGDKP